jgi:YD repeat-containing protein
MVRKSYPLILLLFIIGFCFHSQAQTPATSLPQLPRVIPPSPDAAALGKYGDLPISAYTGTPNISIPLYEIKEGDITVPISLSYHASGVKVEEEASWAGLGWTLNAGGVLTKSIVGKDDETAIRGYFHTPPPPDPIEANTMPGTITNGAINMVHNAYMHPVKCQPIVNGVMQNLSYADFVVWIPNTDWQPDRYFFNFAGYSGKFIMGRDRQPILLDQQKIAISYSNTNSIWQIKTPNGLTYEFTAVEKTWIEVGSIETGSSWYLTKIKDAKNNEVNFSYVQVGVIRAQPSLSETAIHPGTYSARPNWTTYRAIALSSITWSSGQIVFERDAVMREDIVLDKEANSVSGSNRLKTIKIYNTNSPNPAATSLLKEFEFITSYFVSNTYSGEFVDPAFSGSAKRLKRLRLDRVIERNGNLSKPPYVFTYNSLVLPSKTAYARDHWGYYNAADANTTLLVPYKGFVFTSAALIPYTQTYFDLPGANRSTNENAAKACILESIQYPTGGKSTFEYQAHRGKYEGMGNYRKTETTTVSAFAIPPAPDPYKYQYETVTFTAYENGDPYSTIQGAIANEALITLKFNYNVNSYTQSFAYGDVKWAIYQEGDDVNPYKIWQMQGPLRNSGSPSSEEYKWQGKVGLIKGKKYTLKVLCPTKLPSQQVNLQIINEIRIDVQMQVKAANQEEMVGGLRVSKITDYDGINSANNKVRVFQYENGSLMTYPFNSRQYIGYGSARNGVLERSASSNIPLGASAQGSHIGYGKVTELQGSDGAFGKTVSFFHNKPDVFDDYLHRMTALPTFPDLLNGTLESQEIYKKEGINELLVKRIQNNYVLANQKIIRGAIGERRMSLYDDPNWGEEMHGFCGPVELNPGSHLHFYDIPSAWVQLQSTEETVVDQVDATRSLTTKTEYFYDNPTHYQVTRTEKTVAPNEKVISLQTYPEDYTDATGFVNNLKQAFIVAPIEKVTYRSVLNTVTNTTTYSVIGGELSTYYADNKGLANEVFTLDVTSPIAFSTFKFSNKDNGMATPWTQPNRTFSKDSRYRRVLQFQKYDPTNSNLLQLQTEKGPFITYLWGYNNRFPIAEVKNAGTTENKQVVFHTSFEETGTTDSQAKTGTKVNVGAYSVPLPTVTGPYVLTYFEKGTQGWLFKQLDLNLIGAGGSQAIGSATTSLDEVRLYPKGAQMTTYTYNPLIGMTSATDAACITTYFEYDALQRLLAVKDQDGNIIKSYVYHYKGQ